MEELLHKAIENGDKKRVQELIKKGASMDKLMGLRGTALCAAISDNKVEIACYLIEAGCDVNGDDYDKEPPLLLAMRKECFAIVKILIGHPKSNLNKPDPLTKLNALCFAAKNGQTKVVDWLIKAGIDLKGKDGDGNTALHLAISNSHYSIIEKLVKCGCDIATLNDEGLEPIHLVARVGDHRNLIKILSPLHVIEENIPSSFCKLSFSETVWPKVCRMLHSETKFSLETPLLIAAKRGHSDLIKLLLMCGANPNFKGFPDTGTKMATINKQEHKPCIVKSTPMSRLCICYQKCEVKLDVIKWILEAGFNVETASLHETRDGQLLITALTYSAIYNLYELAKLLVQSGADVNNTFPERNALYEAISNNSLDVVWYFLNECNVNYKTKIRNSGQTFFHAALALKEPNLDKVLTHLLMHNCLINEPDKYGKTPLYSAVESQNTYFVRKILEKKANVQICDKKLDSPLHKCAEVGSVEIARLLLLYGADINSKNACGMTPLDIALEDMEDDDHKELAILLLNNCAFVTPSALDLLRQTDDNPGTGCDIDVGDSDSDLSSVSSDSNEELETILKRLISQQINGPNSLFMQTVFTIRCHFSCYSIPFENVSKLPIPKSFAERILMI